MGKVLLVSAESFGNKCNS